MTAGSRYHSPLREEQAAATRSRILEACVALMRTGADLTYSAVATRAGVQERTVYRHFPTRGDLEAGLWTWIRDHLTHVDFSVDNTDDLVKALHRSFSGFDADALLIQAMLHSDEGLEVRLRQQPERRAMFEACIANTVPGLPTEVRLRAAAGLQVLYSATSWDLLRSFWGLDGAQAADVVELAIRALLAGLRLEHDATVRDLLPRDRPGSEASPRPSAARARQSTSNS